MSAHEFEHPVIGQEAICPDGLGRVVAVKDDFPFQWIQVDTYVGNRSCQWDPKNVQLIPLPVPVPAAGNAFVIKSSELGNRWDAGFHQFHKAWQDKADAIEGSISKDNREKFEQQIVERLSSPIFNLESLSIFQPLLTGSQQISRDSVIRAAQKYPYLVAAVMSSEVMDDILKTRQQLLHDQANEIGATRAQLGSISPISTKKTRSP